MNVTFAWKFLQERVRPFSLMQRGDTFDFAQFQAKHIVICFFGFQSTL